MSIGQCLCNLLIAHRMGMEGSPQPRHGSQVGKDEPHCLRFRQWSYEPRRGVKHGGGRILADEVRFLWFEPYPEQSSARLAHGMGRAIRESRTLRRCCAHSTLQVNSHTRPPKPTNKRSRPASFEHAELGTASRTVVSIFAYESWMARFSPPTAVARLVIHEVLK